MQTDPLGDFLTSIRNASRSGGAEVVTFYSRMKSDVAHVLQKEGYLTEVETITNKGELPKLKVRLRGRGKTRAITSLKRESKPGLRKYVGSKEIPNVLGGMGISVLSTSQGIMSGHAARKQKLGGELLLSVY